MQRVFATSVLLSLPLKISVLTLLLTSSLCHTYTNGQMRSSLPHAIHGVTIITFSLPLARVPLTYVAGRLPARFSSRSVAVIKR